MKLSLSSTTILLFLGLNSAYSQETHLSMETEEIELRLEGLLAPYQGYDHTDNIEIVLHGSLPNPCYRLDRYEVERFPNKNSLQIRQFAIKKLDGVCAEGSSMPEHLKMTVPFTNVISLGSMSPGYYNFRYNDTNNEISQKTFHIKEAHKTTIDDYLYAAVSNASTTDVIRRNEKMTVTLSGVFTNSCAYLDKDSVKIERQKDAYVVLPVLKMRPGLCVQSLIPFAHTIEIEAPKAIGHYLIHVRSMNGKSVNRVVEALE